MISFNRGCVLFVVACSFLESANGQEAGAASGGAAPGSGSAPPGASSNFGAPLPPAPSGTGGIPAGGTGLPGATTPGALPGSQSEGNVPSGGSRIILGTGSAAPGPATNFGNGSDGMKPSNVSEPTYVIPAGYGKPSQQFTAGEGRLARPKFRYTGSLSFGYDDNILQTPTNSPGTPDTVVTVVTSPGTPARTEEGVDSNGLPVTLVVPGTAPTTGKVVIPGIPGQQRIGSFVNRQNVGFDVQFASRKTLFTFDIRAGADVYWDRPGNDVLPTGSLALMYLRRLNSRLQFTASVNSSYQIQPNLSQVNTSTLQGGSFLTTNTKVDTTYRFSPRISTIGSLSYNAVKYEQSTEQFSGNREFILGAEVRYLFSPHLTLLTEVRYGTIAYPTTSNRDAYSIFGLVGGEWAMSRRFSGTLRLGVEQRTFVDSSTDATSPYGEATMTYQLAKATVIRLNSRYGQEAPQNAGSNLVSLRAGLSLVQSFSPRLRGTIGTNVVRQNTTTVVNDAATAANPANIQSTVDAAIGFEYTLNRHWTLNANYSYVTGFGTLEANDYYRNRIFFGGEYEF